MNVYTIRDNLLKTIAGKEKYLAELRYRVTLMTIGEELAAKAVIKFVEINLDELYGILNDVQECCKQASGASWRDNPDRMGGQFTAEEINRTGEWR